MTDKAKELLDDLKSQTNKTLLDLKNQINKVLFDLVAENEELEEQLTCKGDFIEILKGMTNGEVVQALWEVQEITVLEVCVFVDCYPNINMRFNKEWWNAPYKSEKPETCKGCLEPCIMYEPDMRACKHKVTKRGEADGQT